MNKKRATLNFENVLEKKSISNHNENNFIIFSVVLFTLFFLWSFASSMPSIKKSSNTQEISKTISTAEKVSLDPDITLAYLLNYKTNQNIMTKEPRFNDYLKDPTRPINLNELEGKNLNLNIQLSSHNVTSGLDFIKSRLIEEDLYISPFTGEFLIESEIIQTTQSENYYMVEVVKTFTQGKKVIKVLERKAFQLKSLQSGSIDYFANILFTSTKINK